jgi:hypothetical protein
MSRLAFLLFSIVSGLTVACSSNDEGWDEIAVDDSRDYRVQLKTYGSEYADKPFSVRITSRNDPLGVKNEFDTRQCRNVQLLATKDEVLFFYDKIVLDDFTNHRLPIHQPKMILCDLAFEPCAKRLEAVKANGATLVQLCSMH